MRTASRLAVSAALLGSGLLIAGPAAAQQACDDTYDNLAECPIGGGGQAPVIDVGEDTSDGGTTSAGGSTTSAASLPFTGGEVTLIALAGTAALGGGIALTAAGRRRTTG